MNRRLPKLTYQILELLPLCAGEGWEIRANKTIRNARGECPLCSLLRNIFEEHGSTVLPSLAVVRVGLTLSDNLMQGMFPIIQASDVDHRLRKKLMDRLEIEE